MPSEATQILSALASGDRSGSDRLMELVYDDFRRLAASYLEGDTAGNTLQPTAVVHEAFIKIVGEKGADWRGRSHFFAVGATAMRQILVDHARKKSAVKRGGGRARIDLDERLAVSVHSDDDVLAIDEVLNKLACINSRRAKIVEMRFFGGMTVDEVAVTLGVSSSAVKKQWTATSAWLRRELAEAQ
jgi:RNA polymerase sigma-70 factor, ECF subfamily